MFRLFGIHSSLQITAADTVIVGVRGRETSTFRALSVFSGCPASSPALLCLDRGSEDMRRDAGISEPPLCHLISTANGSDHLDTSTRRPTRGAEPSPFTLSFMSLAKVSSLFCEGLAKER